MAKSARGFDARLAAVRAGEAKAVDAALAGESGILIAAAVPHVAADPRRFDEFVAAFDRLCGDDAAQRDPACRGKIAIVRALIDAEHWDEVFVRGLHLKQLEGFDQDDTAAAVRALCGHAHVQMYRPDAAEVLAELLADKQRTTRLGAAQSLAGAGPYATPLLRFKMMIGDPEPQVLAACVDSLLSLTREASIPFVIRLLANPAGERASVAAVGLGAARVTEATEALIRYCAAAPPEARRRAGYVALALLRTDEATGELVRVVREEHRADAIAAAKALATFEENREALRGAAAKHPDAAVRKEVAELTDVIG